MTPKTDPARPVGAPKTSALARSLQVLGIGVLSAAVIIARPANPLSANNADPTFAEDVAPILYKNCTGCHRPGAIGPFPLFEYDSAKAYTDEMYEKISQRQMPPWHAEGARGVFRNDRRLSEADRSTILRWIDAGAKPGDLKKLPARPVYPTSWSIGTPDLVLTMGEDFTVPATGMVEYQHFEVPSNLTTDKWVQALEVMPGAREVVHHAMIYAKSPPGLPLPPGVPPYKQALARNPNYELPPVPPKRGLFSIFKPEPKDFGTLIGTLAPGTNALEFPKGTALLLRAGTVLTISMHYTAHGHAMKDRTSVGFRFAKEMPEEQIYATIFSNDAFTIPPGAKVQIPSEVGAKEHIKVWGMLPHTHVRGTRWQYKLVRPDGTSEIILDIPNYDFNWQTYYLWSKPLELAPGEMIKAVAWYDNSPSNKHNPDARKEVKVGQQTWDEMQSTGLLYSVPGRTLPPTRK
jgi:hypothetical protein